jgi:hypothetical protein
MKAIKIFAMAFASTALLASCAVEPGGGADNGDRAVKIQISQKKGTRAVTDPVAEDTYVKLNDGYLIFTNANDAVTFVIDILDATATGVAAAYNETAGTVGVAALETGEWITSVPGASTKVYLIGNYSGDAPEINDDVKQITDNVLNQYSSGGVDDVVIYGWDGLDRATEATYPSGDVDPDDGVLSDDDYIAEIDVAPIVARFEIGGITGTPSKGDGHTFTYTIEGFFWDKYYDQMYVTGAAMGSVLKSNLSTVEHYLPGGGS